MAAVYEQIRPAINLWSSKDASDSVLNELKLGMEEEGLPYEIEEGSTHDALQLGWEAAQASRLEVGIGLDAQFVILHFAKLDRAEPLYKISARSALEKVRALGANAARLVKKQPLKPLDGR